MSQVTRRVLPLVVLLFSATAPQRLSAQESRPAWEFGFRGVVLMNGYYNDAQVNQFEDPAFATVPFAGVSQHSIGGTVRQTRLVGTGDLADFAGGTLHAELDVDFFGALSAGTRSGPALRIRRAFGEVRWDRLSVLVGQEGPLVADVNPVSLATVGVPGYATAGNLWLWIPQVRVGYDLNGGAGPRFGIDVAALAPNPPEAFMVNAIVQNAAEASGRPMFEARLRARWGEGAEVGIGGHRAWLNVDPDDDLLTTEAVVMTAILPLGSTVDLRGEWYTGKGMASLGGGGVAQLMHGDNTPLESSGGWAQLNLKAGPRWEFGAGYGFDEPDGGPDTTSTTFRTKNTQYSARIQWRLTPVVVAFEYRHFATEYGGGAPERTASHLNLAAGVEF